MGTNHYSNQISGILPINISKIIAFFYGSFYYSAFFLFCSGVLPILIPILNIKKYQKHDKYFILYLITSMIITILEIVLIVFVIEERDNVFPNKFCFRYLMPLAIPYFIMFIKCNKEDLKITKAIMAVYLIIFGYFIWYFIGDGTKSTSIDAPFLFIIQRLNNDRIMNLKTIFIILYTFVNLIGLIIWKLNKIKNIRVLFLSLFICALVLIFPLNCYCHYIQSNKDTMGKVLKDDFINISNYIERKYDKVYILKFPTGENTCMRSIFPYLISDYETIDITSESKTLDINEKNVIVLVSKDFSGKIEGVNKINIETKYVDIYVSNKEYNTLKITENGEEEI